MKKRFSVLNAVNLFIYLFIVAPLVVVVITSFTESAYLVFPPKGFTFHWYNEVLTGGRYAKPFWNSIWIAVTTTAVALPIGTLIALAFKKYEFRSKETMRSLFLSPLLVPTLLFGIGLLIFYSNLGVSDYFFRLVMAHIILTVPYVVRTMSAGFARLDRSVEEASLILGATPWQTLRLVTIPLVRPALMASAFFAFIMSFDELVMALFLTGPGMVTLPMLIYSDIQFNMTPAIAAASSIIILGTVLIGLIGMSMLKRNKIL
ncbi:ABC transporter permease [Paenibacillus ginsengarvi]|uniref:ABC transporter permease n=1 Tax=Paenibacillus ginsengarvi TaxID=400777 RepID=A0A3B0AR64_9BACL|nr:ABC transporter permease [Paenibacillus ginsengarvi]RKN62988.1 ABC transporter permease [Paenibacillus ginsengarvi]